MQVNITRKLLASKPPVVLLATVGAASEKSMFKLELYNLGPSHILVTGTGMRSNGTEFFRECVPTPVAPGSSFSFFDEEDIAAFKSTAAGQVPGLITHSGLREIYIRYIESKGEEILQQNINFDSNAKRWSLA